MKSFLIIFIFGIVLLGIITDIRAEKNELWKITAYCGCSKCCGKWSDGYMASGKKCRVGYCACNILPFKTKIKIDDLGIYEVQDRGAKKYFNNQKHIDIYFDTHEEAKNFGVKYKMVEILGGK